MNLLSVSNDAKTVKGEKKGYLTGILYLAPTSVLCPASSKGCRRACLFSAGRGRFNSTILARKRKTQMFLKSRDKFIALLEHDISMLIAKSKKRGMIPCVRINGTSDIDVQDVFAGTLKKFKDIQFYDYTKVWSRSVKFPNYHLTYSRSEDTSWESIADKLDKGCNVAIVFKGDVEYLKYMTIGGRDYPVSLGDDTDLRFLDEPGHIIALTAKGKAKDDKTGFVVEV